MSQQTEFVLRNDGFWWAPPIDPSDECDYTVRFTRMLGEGDTIESITSVTVTNATLGLYEVGADGTEVVVWISAPENKKVVTVATKILTEGGRRFERSFKIDCKHL